MADEKKKPNNPADKAPAKGGKPEGAGKGKGPSEGKGKPGGGKPKGSREHAGEEAPAGPRVEPRLQTRFKAHVKAELAKQFGLINPMQHPRLTKIVVNINMGRHLEGTKIPANVKTTVLETIQKITGQKPVVLKAKKSVSNFKVREGLETAAMVTLRRDRMWHFLDRVINLACPRIKDFRGLKDTGFDRQGNYAFGLTEQGVFPEINMAEATFTHGMNINVCFERSEPKLSRFVLAELGFPFAKPEEKARRSA
ncbi:MAG: 50S ribosomal protein L5 [Planctomyces sp.]|nr:50S ribosomal protein L5 [Planctomyces sp.]MBA4119411.1 50S ribosomal protein L5 [Isosphaera sp.]